MKSLIFEENNKEALTTITGAPEATARGVYDLTYIIVSIILPTVANLLLSLDVADYLKNVYQLCSCFHFVNVNHVGEPANDLPMVIRQDICYGLNGTSSKSIPMSSISTSQNSFCDTFSATMAGMRLAVIIVAATSFGLVIIISAIIWRTQRHVLVLICSLISVVPEFATSFVIISSPQPFLDPSSIFYLQIGIICSTGVALILNLFGEGDAQILRNMGMRKGKRRLFILSIFQTLYIFSVAVNVGAVATYAQL
jgi:hypothetical protein